MRFTNYQSDGFYDELFETDGQPRESARLLVQKIESMPEGEVEKRQKAAERAFLEAPYRPRDEINDQNPVRRPRAYLAD